MRDRLLNWLARFVWRHPYSVIAVAAVLAVYCAMSANSQLQVNADTNDLISPNRPYMKDFLAFMKEFGDTEYIYAVVASPDDSQRERVETCVEALTERISRIEGLPGVFSGVTPQEQLRIATRAKGMSDENLADLALASAAFPAILSGDPAQVIHRSYELLQVLVERGNQLNEDQQKRVGAAAVFLLKAIAASREDSASRHDLAFLLGEGQHTEYFKSETGRLYFITIMPAKDYGTLSVIEEPLRKIREAIAEVRTQFPGIDIGLTGKPVLQADEMATTSNDMTLASILAFVLCTALFILMMGDPWRQMLAMLAFLIGSAWTYGAATLLVGQLNLLSIVFMLVLVGVGLDYGTHILARYKEHRLAGEDTHTALRAAILTAIRGNITGALTSCSVFFMALFTTFQGLRELGLIAGVGLLLCLVSMSVALPALLAIVDRRRKPLATHGFSKANGLDRNEGVLHLMIARPGTVLITAMMITLSLIFAPGTIHFDQNLLNLQATGLESVQWERRLAEDTASNTWFGVVIVNDVKQIPQVEKRAAGRPTIGSMHSVLDIIELPAPHREAHRQMLHETTLNMPPATQPAATGPQGRPEGTTEPSPSTQDSSSTQPGSWTLADLRSATAKLDLIALAATARDPEHAGQLRQISADLKALERELQIESRFTSGQTAPSESSPTTAPATRAHRLARDRIELNIKSLAASLSAMLRGDEMSLYQALPDSLRRQFMSPDGRFTVLVHPRGDVWEYEQMRAFIADLRAVDPYVTGVPITHFESLGEMRRSFVIMSVLAFLVIAALVWIDFRKIKDVALTMLPLIIGMAWLVEIMGLLGLSFNLANFFSVPILIGVGVDSSVHILHRYHEGGPSRFSLGSTRRAVILTSLTTIIGFGCLVLAHHRGLRSLGLVMAIGSTACLLSSVIILPAMLAWFEKHPPHYRKVHLTSW